MKNIRRYYSPWIDVFTFLIMIASFLYVIFTFNSLPTEIPIHFNMAGRADGWGHKGMLIGLIILNFHTVILCFVLNYFLIVRSDNTKDSLHLINIPFVKKAELTEEQVFLVKKNTARMLASLNLLVSILFASLYHDSIQGGLGNQSGLGYGVGITTALILYVCIYYTWKSYSDVKQSKNN